MTLRQFATKVKSTRALMRLTQEGFAAALGVAVQTIHAWEQEVQMPRGFQLKAITNTLDTMAREAATAKAELKCPQCGAKERQRHKAWCSKPPLMRLQAGEGKA